MVTERTLHLSVQRRSGLYVGHGVPNLRLDGAVPANQGVLRAWQLHEVDRGADVVVGASKALFPRVAVEDFMLELVRAVIEAAREACVCVVHC